MTGELFLVSTPIGNPGDITIRSKRVLSEVDLVICEEVRIGGALLAHLKLDKPMVELNEHTDSAEVDVLVERLAAGQNLALISDHGTPLVADPGAGLVSKAIASGIRVTPIPGASSVTGALVTSGLPGKRFRFLGALPPKTDSRRRALFAVKDVRETLVLIDAPYRLPALLKSISEVLGETRQIVVACNLTMPDERVVRGTVRQIVKVFEKTPFKGEFVCVLQGEAAPAHSKRS